MSWFETQKKTNVKQQFYFSQASGLSEYIGLQLAGFSEIPSFLVCVLCIVIICILTQCTSNTATATVFLPILASLVCFCYVDSSYFLLIVYFDYSMFR